MMNRLPKTRLVQLAAGAALLMAGNHVQAKGIFDTDPAEGGFYVSGFVGAGFLGDADFDGTQDPAPGSPGVVGAPANVDVDFDTDVYFGGAVGYRLPYRFLTYVQPSLELEISYIDADVGSGSTNGGDQSFGGSQERLFIFVNSLAEIIWSEDQAFIPYIGGGLGAGFIDSSIEYFPNNGVATSPTFAVQGTDTGVTSHTMLGVRIPVNEQFEIYGEGRYVLSLNIDADRRFVGDGGETFNARVNDDLDAFTLTAGLRWKF